MDASFIVKDLYERRNMRLVFQKHGFYLGGAEAALMTLTRRRVSRRTHRDGRRRRRGRASARRRAPFAPDGKLTFAKVDAVFKSGNATRDDIPSHLIVAQDVPPEAAELYAAHVPGRRLRAAGRAAGA